MTPAEVAAAREELGLSPEGLAAELGVSPREARAWEAGTHAIDRRSAERLAFHLALTRTHKALEAAGLPECAWLAEWNHRPFPETSRAVRRHVGEMEEHVAACERCRARDAYAAEHLPPLPPVPRADGWMGVLDAFAGQVKRLPAWLRPAAWGAAVVGVMALFRAALMLSFEGRFPLAEVPLAIGAGAVLGAVGGIAYALVREPARRLGRAGPYVTGVACVWAYLAAAGVMFSGTEELDAMFVFFALTYGGLIGLLVGHMLFRPMERNA